LVHQFTIKTTNSCEKKVVCPSLHYELDIVFKEFEPLREEIRSCGF
jgi:hypothetical protein